MADVVRAEALRSNYETGVGRPLPLVAHWHRRYLPLSDQINLLEQGYPIIPWMAYGRTCTVTSEEESSLDTLESWNLPIVLLHGNQWDSAHYDSEGDALPLEQTGAGQNLDGTRMNKVSPMSPVQPWYDLGVKWSTDGCVDAISSIYTDPPLVIFLSNNETARLGWGQLETEKRFVDQYGTGTGDDFRRQLASDNYAERYRAMFNGMKDSLTQPGWQEDAIFTGYNAFPPDHYARSHAYGHLGAPDDGWVSNEPSYWDGGVPELYDNDWEPTKTAFSLYSMQTEAMNMEFLKEHDVFPQNPEFWHEFITWDGYTWRESNAKLRKYDYSGAEYTPDLYEGWTRYGLWIMTPRVMREWRSSADAPDDWYPYWQRMLDAVKAVHDDATLTRFWREGELVANPDVLHPFRFGLAEKFQGVRHWYHLSTDLDPALNRRGDNAAVPFYYEHSNPDFPVWTMARVLGKVPNREWLVYAHAPLGDRQNVHIKIPDHCIIEMDIPIEGAFKRIIEGDGSCDNDASLDESGLRLHFTFDEEDVDAGETTQALEITKFATISEASPDTASPGTLEVDETLGARRFAFFELDLSSFEPEFDLTRIDIALSGTSLSGDDAQRPYIGAKVYSEVDFDPAIATWNAPPVNLMSAPVYDDIEGLSDDETDWELYLTRQIRDAFDAGAGSILVGLYNVNNQHDGSFTDRTISIAHAPTVTLYEGRGNPRVYDTSGNGFSADWHRAVTGSLVPGVSGEALSFVDPHAEAIIFRQNILNDYDPELLLDGGGTVSLWVYGEAGHDGEYKGVITASDGSEGWHVYQASGMRFKFITKHQDNGTEWGAITAPEDNAWHMLTYVVEDDGDLQLYLDGQHRATNGPIIPFPEADHFYNVAMNIGSLKVDDVRLYDYALSAGEVQDLYNVMFSALASDFNADSIVNIFDYNILLTHFGATADCGNPADANGDCAVNIFDYNVLLGEFGMSG